MGLEQRFQDYMIVSDIDGTLVADVNYYPPRNIEAIKRFQQQGGHFTIATGRPLVVVREIAEIFQVQTPLILINGGCIYDSKTGSFTYEQFLPDTARGYLEQFAKHPATAIIRIMASDETIYSVYTREGVNAGLPTFDRKLFQVATMEEIGHLKWRKALLITLPEEAPELRSYVDGLNLPDVDFIASSATYYEMLPPGVSKGNGIRVVADQLGIEMKNTFAIGDYDNDLDMLRAAGTGVAPANATDAVKAVADLVVGDCHDGAVADLIEHLEATINCG